jgi:exosome complex component CSL4
MEKKLVLPGDHLSSAEEAEPGENTYSERDEVYSAAVGENGTMPGQATVTTKGRTLRQPKLGMVVYCLIIKASLNKAIGGCIPVEEAESGIRGVEIEAVLPVTSIRSGYVRDLRDEVKIGDIIKAKIRKVEKTGFEISMFEPDCGVVVAFCPRCRERMAVQERMFICPDCGWKERRKLPLKEGESPPEGYGPREQYGERGGFRERRGPPRERGGGFRRGGSGERRRTFGRRPGPGGRQGSY